MQHFRDHDLLLLDLPVAERFHLGDQTGVLDHVCHQFCGVSPDGEELQEGVSYEVCEDIVGCDADAVAVALQRVSECDERLYIPATAHDLDDDVELDVARGCK